MSGVRLCHLLRTSLLSLLQHSCYNQKLINSSKTCYIWSLCRVLKDRFEIVTAMLANES